MILLKIVIFALEYRYVFGSLVFGVLYDKLNKLLLLAFTSFWFAVCTCVKPWCSLFPVMIVVSFLAGTFCGGLDTGMLGLVSSNYFCPATVLNHYV